uniref:C-type lectin domain-containing protein n=1 Tax=Oreochromis niloticus TaxID=8128 RepID=A0A669B5N6_ORENI
MRWPLCSKYLNCGVCKMLKWYILITQTRMGWTEAQDYCRTNHTDLTSVRNDAEHQTIQSLANGTDVWIGLFRDPWEWSDLSNSSLRYWPVEQKIWNEGSENCGALLKNESGKWGQLPCSDRYPFLCTCEVKGFLFGTL